MGDLSDRMCGQDGITSLGNQPPTQPPEPAPTAPQQTWREWVENILEQRNCSHGPYLKGSEARELANSADAAEERARKAERELKEAKASAVVYRAAKDARIEECDKLTAELAQARAELARTERCDECNHELTQCGPQDDDGEPTLDCLVCKLRAELAALKADNTKLFGWYNDAEQRLAIALKAEPQPVPLDRPDKPGKWWKWDTGLKEWMVYYVRYPENWTDTGKWLPATPPPAPSE